MTTQTELFEHFGIKDTSKIIKGVTFHKVKDILEGMIEDHSWVSFAGSIGSGKTVTVFEALKELGKNEKVEFVEITAPNRKGIGDSELLLSIIYRLGEKYDGTKTAPPSNLARDHMVQRILAKAKMKDITVVLVIDEAQELKGDTFNIIKRFRDVKLLGTGNTLGVVMIGQPNLPGMIDQNKEVSLRVRSYDFDYTQAEKVDLAMHFSNGLLDENQARVVAEKAVFDEYGKVTALSIENAILTAMDNAYKVGDESLSMYHFEFKNQPKAKKSKPRKKIKVKANGAAEVAERIGKQAS